nr:hypothetical protein [uncultured Rhodopila sp.]
MAAAIRRLMSAIFCFAQAHGVRRTLALNVEGLEVLNRDMAGRPACLPRDAGDTVRLPGNTGIYQFTGSNGVRITMVDPRIMSKAIGNAGAKKK